MKRFFSTLLIATLVLGAMMLASCDLFDKVVPEHEHDFTVEVVNPTCVDRGYTEYTCECGYVMRDSFVEPAAKGHSYDSNVVEPTCTTDGYTEHTCTICGDYYTDKPKQGGHTMGSWEVVEAPSCDRMGVDRRSCENCEYFEERNTAAAHPYETVVVTEPTCLDRGYTTYTCSCGAVKVDDYIDALGHNFNGAEWEVGKAQTCTETGELHRHCQNEGCDHYEVKSIGKHSYGDPVVVPPTCTEYGYTSYVCTECGHEIIKDIVDPTGHEWQDSKCIHCDEEQ